MNGFVRHNITICCLSFVWKWVLKIRGFLENHSIVLEDQLVVVPLVFVVWPSIWYLDGCFDIFLYQSSRGWLCPMVELWLSWSWPCRELSYLDDGFIQLVQMMIYIDNPLTEGFAGGFLWVWSTYLMHGDLCNFLISSCSSSLVLFMTIRPTFDTFHSMPSITLSRGLISYYYLSCLLPRHTNT